MIRGAGVVLCSQIGRFDDDEKGGTDLNVIVSGKMACFEIENVHCRVASHSALHPVWKAGIAQHITGGQRLMHSDNSTAHYKCTRICKFNVRLRLIKFKGHSRRRQRTGAWQGSLRLGSESLPRRRG